MKTFFDGIFIDGSNAQNEGEYPIKLEYYQTVKTEENVEAKYGIEIVETEFLNGKVNIEMKTIDEISNNLEEVKRILIILKDNEVTPIGMEDAIEEIVSL